MSQIAADGRTCEHDRGLGSHTATETDGDGRGNYRTPAVVSPQPASLAADGIEYSCDTVADFILHDISHKKRGEVNTDDRIYQVHPVEGVDVESKGEGDDWSELVTGLFADIFDDILKQKKEKEKKVEETPEEKISRLMDEIQSLKIDNEILKQRLESTPEEKKVTNKKSKYNNAIQYSNLDKELQAIFKDLGL